jgi:hypothetical protein
VPAEEVSIGRDEKRWDGNTAERVLVRRWPVFRELVPETSKQALTSRIGYDIFRGVAGMGSG